MKKINLDNGKEDRRELRIQLVLAIIIFAIIGWIIFLS